MYVMIAVHYSHDNNYLLSGNSRNSIVKTKIHMSFNICLKDKRRHHIQKKLDAVQVGL